MPGLVCCRRQRPLDDTKPNTKALYCFVLGVAIVKGGGISRRLGLFNVKKAGLVPGICLVWGAAQKASSCRAWGYAS